MRRPATCEEHAPILVELSIAARLDTNLASRSAYKGEPVTAPCSLARVILWCALWPSTTAMVSMVSASAALCGSAVAVGLLVVTCPVAVVAPDSLVRLDIRALRGLFSPPSLRSPAIPH